VRSATRQYESNISGAQVWVDGDDRGTEVHAGEIEYGQFTAVRDHDANTIAVADVTIAELSSQCTRQLVKLPVANLPIVGGIHKKRLVRMLVDNVDYAFLDCH
jgi:hypothetical protein